MGTVLTAQDAAISWLLLYKISIGMVYQKYEKHTIYLESYEYMNNPM